MMEAALGIGHAVVVSSVVGHKQIEMKSKTHQPRWPKLQRLQRSAGKQLACWPAQQTAWCKGPTPRWQRGAADELNRPR